MYAIQLDMYQAAAVAALVLLLGRFLVRNLDLLRRYCIPDVAFRAKCKIFSRHLQKPILKTEKGRFKGL